MSDLHGCFETYKAMLKKIDFSDDDILYILGDVIDRGPKPVSILLDLMERANVVVLAGNHCAMACQCFIFLMMEITDKSVGRLDENMVMNLMQWQINGAQSTIDEFRKCNRKTQTEIIDFITDFDLCEQVEVGGKTFILVHGGLGNFAPDKQLYDYTLDEIVWERPDYSKAYFSDKYVVTGHTPTMSIKENKRPGYIFHSNNHIAIDCGCTYKGGRLACIRLDDMKEFYVDNMEK